MPKPLVEIGERPILWHIMKLYGHFGVRRFILCLGYKSWLIKEFFLRYREQVADFTVHLGSEDPPTFHTARRRGLGGHARRDRAHDRHRRPAAARARLHRHGHVHVHLRRRHRPVDLGELLEFHRAHGRIGTVTGVHPTSRYGEMRVEDGVVAEFNEKPTTPDGFVSGGFFVFQREFFDYLERRPGAVLRARAAAGPRPRRQLAVYPHEDFWMGMDTYREFAELNKLWAGRGAWKVWAAEHRVGSPMSAISDTFWAGRRVLVTGHTGFKGRWLSLWLRSLGAEVLGFSRRCSEGPGGSGRIQGRCGQRRGGAGRRPRRRGRRSSSTSPAWRRCRPGSRTRS